MSPQERQQAIYATLQAKLQPTSLEVIDESYQHVGHKGHGGAGHFAVRIVAPCFTDKSLVAQHRLVYAALNDLMGTEIHALRIDSKALD